MKLKIYTDGACSGNPGPAGIGIAIYKDKEVVKEIAKSIGEATNNIAEYTALVQALKEAEKMKAESVDVFMDSELVYKQVIGQYKVKHPNMKPLFEEVQRLKNKFKDFNIQHVRREFNQHADRLSKEAITTSAS